MGAPGASDRLLDAVDTDVRAPDGCCQVARCLTDAGDGQAAETRNEVLALKSSGHRTRFVELPAEERAVEARGDLRIGLPGIHPARYAWWIVMRLSHVGSCSCARAQSRARWLGQIHDWQSWTISYEGPRYEARPLPRRAGLRGDDEADHEPGQPAVTGIPTRRQAAAHVSVGDDAQLSCVKQTMRQRLLQLEVESDPQTGDKEHPG